MEEGSLYPALYRLELDGAISANWGLSENNRRPNTTNSPRKAGIFSQSITATGPACRKRSTGFSIARRRKVYEAILIEAIPPQDA